MAKLDWAAFLAAHPDAHCVRLEVLLDGAPATNLRQLSDTVKRLVRDRMKPRGVWALQLYRHDGSQSLECAFAQLEDARLLAGMVSAIPCPKSSEWLSYWSAQLNEELLETIYQLAGPPDGGRNRPPRRYRYPSTIG